MALLLWAAMANGGKLYQLDDTSVGGDLSGGADAAAFTCTLTSSPFPLGGYGSLRRAVMNLETASALTLTVQSYRDGAVTGDNLIRSVAATEQVQTIPMKTMGSEAQVYLTLSGWGTTTTPAASIGAVDLTIVPKRGARGGNET